MTKLKTTVIIARVLRLLLNVGFVGEAAGIWLIVIFAANSFGALISRQELVAPSLSSALYDVFLHSSCAVIWGLAVAGCAVNVHRFILRGERPIQACLTATEWRYLLRSVRVLWPGVLLPACIILAWNVGAWVHAWPRLPEVREWGTYLADPAIHLIVNVVSIFALTLFVVRRSLSLPAVALGRDDFTLRDSRTATAADRTGLFLIATLLGFVPSVIIAVFKGPLVLGFKLAGSSLAATAVQTFISAGFDVLQILLWAALLSYVYAALVERNGELLE